MSTVCVVRQLVMRYICVNIDPWKIHRTSHPAHPYTHAYVHKLTSRKAIPAPFHSPSAVSGFPGALSQRSENNILRFDARGFRFSVVRSFTVSGLRRLYVPCKMSWKLQRRFVILKYATIQLMLDCYGHLVKNIVLCHNLQMEGNVTKSSNFVH